MPNKSDCSRRYIPYWGVPNKELLINCCGECLAVLSKPKSTTVSATQRPGVQEQQPMLVEAGVEANRTAIQQLTAQVAVLMQCGESGKGWPARTSLGQHHAAKYHPVLTCHHQPVSISYNSVFTSCHHSACFTCHHPF